MLESKNVTHLGLFLNSSIHKDWYPMTYILSILPNNWSLNITSCFILNWAMDLAPVSYMLSLLHVILFLTKALVIYHGLTVLVNREPDSPLLSWLATTCSWASTRGLLCKFVFNHLADLIFRYGSCHFKVEHGDGVGQGRFDRNCDSDSILGRDTLSPL